MFQRPKEKPQKPAFYLSVFLDKTKESIVRYIIDLEPNQRDILRNKLEVFVSDMRQRLIQVEQEFMVTAGYPNIEATKKGLLLWANGSINKKLNRLNARCDRFLSESSAGKPSSSPVLAPEEKQEDQAVVSVEGIAKHYALFKKRCINAEQAVKVIGVMSNWSIDPSESAVPAPTMSPH